MALVVGKPSESMEQIKATVALSIHFVTVCWMVNIVKTFLSVFILILALKKKCFTSFI